MKRLFFLIVPMLLWGQPKYSQAALWGCKPAKLVSGKTTTGCLKVGRQARKFRLHIPETYTGDSALPLVIALHGGGGKPKQLEKYSKLSRLSERSITFIAVYPEGMEKHWNDGRQNVNAGIDDVQFLKQLVSHLKKTLRLRIDDKKIIIIGMSNGGLMAMRMACEQPKWLFGVGVVAASMTTDLASTCAKTAKPLAMVFVFGDQDTAFLSDGRQVKPFKASQQLGSHIGIAGTIKLWREINQCADAEVMIPIDRDKKDKTQVTRRAYKSCEKPVVFYDVKGGGHRWPDVEASNGRFLVKRLNLGLASHDIDAAKEILTVFLK